MIDLNNYKDITRSRAQLFLLAHLVDCYEKNKKQEFSINLKEIIEATGLLVSSIRVARRRLIANNLITFRKAGFPPKSFYTVNLDKIHKK